jgi:hypothetical protein
LFLGAGDDGFRGVSFAQEQGQSHAPKAGEVGRGLERVFQPPAHLGGAAPGKALQVRIAHAGQHGHGGEAATLLLG